MARILVVDDSVTVLEAVAFILKEAGHEVLTCACGRRAGRLLQEEPVDLLITDLFMPDVDGLELLREARTLCPATPVVAMSAVTGTLNMLRVARHLGACCTLSKSCLRTELVEVVAMALSMPCCARSSAPADMRTRTARGVRWPSCSRCSAAGIEPQQERV